MHKKLLEELAYINSTCDFSDTCRQDIKDSIISEGLATREYGEGLLVLTPLGEQVLGIIEEHDTDMLDSGDSLMEEFDNSLGYNSIDFKDYKILED